MNLIYYYHHHSESLSKELVEYDEILTTLLNITDKELISEFNNRKEDGVMDLSGNTQAKIDTSISKTVNIIIKKRLLEIGWKQETRIFSEPYYAKEKEFRLDFAKSDISVEVAFNHSGSVSWNIIKPFLASQFNHVKKDIQTKLGVIVAATKDFKDSGGFDPAIGTYDDYVAYFKPLAMLTLVPIVVIGIQPPKSFYIKRKKDNKINRNIGSVVMINT